jgi:hypothetical protein
VINMTRRADAQLRRYDGNDEDLDIAYAHTMVWARDVNLNLDPPMPAEQRGRRADNWRPLIAIADACGWGVGRVGARCRGEVCA